MQHPPGPDGLDIARRELEVARERMMQTVAHELRTPLTIIKGCAELLERLDGEPDPRLIRALLAASDRLETTVAAVTDAADLVRRNLAPEVVPLADVAAAAVAELRQPAAGARVRIRSDAPDARARTCPNNLRTALSCVLDNALKFSPASEPVSVVIAEGPADHHDILVRDRGSGIPPEFLESAFEPFTQAAPSSEGSIHGLGLGLYTARALASQLGGDVTIDATGPEGTLVRLRVPSAPPDGMGTLRD